VKLANILISFIRTNDVRESMDEEDTEDDRGLERWQVGAIAGGSATAAVVIILLLVGLNFSSTPYRIEKDTTLYLAPDIDYWDYVGETLDAGQTYRADWTANKTVHVYALTDSQLQYLYDYGNISFYEYYFKAADGWMEYTANTHRNIYFVFVSSSYAVVNVHTTLFL